MKAAELAQALIDATEKYGDLPVVFSSNVGDSIDEIEGVSPNRFSLQSYGYTHRRLGEDGDPVLELF